jgi:hypothetical protein
MHLGFNYLEIEHHKAKNPGHGVDSFGFELVLVIFS